MIALLLPAILAPAAVLAASFAGSSLLLPALASVAVYPVMAHLVSVGRPGRAVLATLLWAASLSASIIALAARDPGRAGALVIHGPAYRDEMFSFIRSGMGPESDPRRYIPQHLVHLLGFAALSALSGSLLGIAMGAVLIGFMSYYVGALAAAGGAPWTALLLGWPPYAIIRVVGYVVLGVALSRPILGRLLGRPIPFPRRKRFYIAALVLLLTDLSLKWMLAPFWSAILRPCLGQP
ncbi:MAG TPA: hypothetical protein VJ144_02080 [Candidatus Polarisedimenticolia bacterium]|nr:hypothetical protein [Candidatus Polarisedimenticolia bacterium]